MDMPTPNRTGASSGACNHETLERIARALGCTPESFHEPASTGEPKDASRLMQMWLAIRTPQGREAVMAFVGEVLRSERR